MSEPFRGDEEPGGETGGEGVGCSIGEKEEVRVGWSEGGLDDLRGRGVGRERSKDGRDVGRGERVKSGFSFDVPEKRERDRRVSFGEVGRRCRERESRTHHSQRVPTAVTTESPPFAFACMNEQGPSSIIVGRSFLPVGE